MLIGKKWLSAVYIGFVALALFAIVTAPSAVAMVVLVLCLFTLYALNNVGGAFSLRLGQVCGGLIVLGGVFDLLSYLWFAIRGQRVSLVDLVITCLFIALGWFTLLHLSSRGNHPAKDTSS